MKKSPLGLANRRQRESGGRCAEKMEDMNGNWFCVLDFKLLFAQIWRGTMLLEGVKALFTSAPYRI